METGVKKSKIAYFTIFSIIFITFFEYVFQQTVFSRGGLHMYIVIGIFSLTIAKGFMDIKSFSLVWVPFYICIFIHSLISYISVYYVFIYMSTWGFIGLLIDYSEDMIKKIMGLIGFFALVFALGCIFQKLFNELYLSYIPDFFRLESKQLLLSWNKWDMMSGFAYQPTFAAGVICIGIIANWVYWNKGKTFLMQIILYWALILTAKRSFIVLAIVVPMIVYYFSYTKKNKGSKIFVIIGLLGLVFFAYSFLQASESDIVLMERIERTFSAVNTNEATSGRGELADYAIELFKHNYMMGIGFGRFSLYYGTSVHNVYLQLLCETGILGFISFIGPAVVSLLNTIKKAAHLVNQEKKVVYAIKFSLSMQLLFLIYAFVGNPLYNLQWIYIYFLACALSSCTKIKAEGGE